jgi:transketolase
MPLEPLKEKYEAFNWHVLEVDGHNYQQIIDSCNEARAIFEKPVVIIAHTIPGKGVDFMEFDPSYHGKALEAGETVEALRELRTLEGKIEYD